MVILLKRILSVIIFVCLLTSMTSCRGQNGEVIIQERSTIPYSKIQVSNGWDLILTQGEMYSIKIEANENLLDDLKTEVIDDVLIISSTSRAIKGKGIRKKVHLSFIEVNKISADEDSDISVKTGIKSETLDIELNDNSDFDNVRFEGNRFTARLKRSSKLDMSFNDVKQVNIEASGSSEFSLTGIDTETFKLRLSGESEANLFGFTKSFDAQATQESEINANGLTVENCLLSLSSLSEGEITVQDTLDVTLSGESELEVIGSPTFLNKDICNSCKIELK